MYPCFSSSIPFTAARQLSRDQLFSGSTRNLLVYFSSIRLSSYSTYFSTLHLSLNLFTCPGLSLCPYRLSMSTRLSTRLPPIITARGPPRITEQGGIHLRPGTLPRKTPKTHPKHQLRLQKWAHSSTCPRRPPNLSLRSQTTAFVICQILSIHIV
jgi:hypothetical protein